MTATQPPSLDEFRAVVSGDDPISLHRGGVALDIERPLPILVVARARSEGDESVRQLLTGHPARLVETDRDSSVPIQELVATIAEVQADRFDVFCLVELWAGEMREGDQPSFVVGVPTPEEPPPTVEVLVDSLRTAGFPVEVGHDLAPPGYRPLLGPGHPEGRDHLVIGLEVPPIHRDASGTFYPSALTDLRILVQRALQRFFFDFIRVHSNFELHDHRELGRRTIVEAGYEVDRRLTEMAARLDVLMHMTPVNTHTAREEFFASGCEKDPAFHYRLLPFDPDLLKRELYDLPLESVEDPTVASLLRAKRLEIDRTITLLEDRDTPRFLYGSIQSYGAVEGPLVKDAQDILDRTEPSPPTDNASIEEFAHAARTELDAYRKTEPGLSAKVEIRDDMPGLMVSRGNLYLGKDGRVARSRIAPLIQHEVGTHVVTYFNGSVQPLSLLSAGLPGYEETQEGLATFAEYMAGGLDVARIRQVAARVIATRDVIEGASFVDVFRRLVDGYGFKEMRAWSITMRATRSGGSVKDAIYLRGLLAILRYLREGGALEPLLVGKIALDQVPLIEELLWRQVLERPRLVPRWLEGPIAEERLAAARAGLTPLDLIGVTS